MKENPIIQQILQAQGPYPPQKNWAFLLDFQPVWEDSISNLK